MDNQNFSAFGPVDNLGAAPVTPLTPPAPTPLPPMDQGITPTPMPTLPLPPQDGGEGPSLSEPKPKKKAAPAILAAIALFLVAGVAGASYYISTQLNQRTAVAPTAPTSRPMAAQLTIGETVKESSIAPGGATCDADKRDPKRSQTLTFGKAGTVNMFAMNIDVSSSVTVSAMKSGAIIATLTTSGSKSPEKANGSFTVTAGDQIIITTRVASDKGNAYGWREPKGVGICGPTNNACGADKDIKALITFAQNSADITGIQSDAQANTQCWGDAEVGDQTQDFDYNDFALIFGYVTGQDLSTIPNCTEVSGPTTLTLGDTGTYTAKYLAAPTGGLTNGSIFYSNVKDGVDQKDINNLMNPFNPPVTNGQTLTTTFKPTAVGQYWIRCRAWNDGLAECRPPATVDQSPRFPCAGPKYELLVTVVDAGVSITPTPTAAGMPICSQVAVGVFQNGQWRQITKPEDVPANVKIGDTIRLYSSVSVGTKAVRFRAKGPDGVNVFSPEWATGVKDANGGAKGTYYYVELKITKTGQYSFEAQVQ